jgi:hypothetical protein
MKNERSNSALIGTNGEWKGSSNSSCREALSYVNQRRSYRPPKTRCQLGEKPLILTTELGAVVSERTGDGPVVGGLFPSQTLREHHRCPACGSHSGPPRTAKPAAPRPASVRSPANAPEDPTGLG